MFRQFVSLGLVVVLLVAGALALVSAQSNIVLTLAVPQWFQDAYNKDYFNDFRAAHPGVDVVIVPDTENLMYPSSPVYSSVDEHLDGAAKYTALADVLYVSSWTVTPESTAAGLWLNIAPLVAADPSLDEANFYPPAWRAFRWDNGIWALPTTVRPIILMIDPAAFDAAGLNYPTANWTIEDYASTMRTLTEYDANGNPIRLGCWCDTPLLFYGILGHSLADVNGMPILDDPQLATMMEVWSAAQHDTIPSGGYSSENVPMQIMEPWLLDPNMPADRKGMVPGNLPGDVYGAQVEGFAVSSATAYPELAFQLVKYITETPVNTFGAFGTFPALRNGQMAERPNFSTSTIDGLPPEQQEILRNAVETGVTDSDLRYFDYVSDAMRRMADEGLDATTLLQEMQQKILDNREAAVNWSGVNTVVIATPVPTPSFGAEEIALNVGISLWNLPNQRDWERLAREFAENDPQVGVVNLNMQGASDYETWVNENDCFFLNYDAITPYDTGKYLALDPLLNADPNFRPEDFLPGAVEAVQFEGQTFAYPLVVEVAALLYNAEIFEAADIPQPEMDWTIDQFVDALQRLDEYDGGYTVPFVPHPAQDSDWLLLIAAYGGLPLDFRVEPMTWDFTTPETVDAIRQVLDLAKAGLIDYQKLGTFNFGGGGVFGAAPLESVSLSGWETYGSIPIHYVNYPRGSRYPVMSLGNIGGGYISASSLNPEACYRWIAFIADHPELVPNMMPARLSALDDPALTAAQGEDAVALYREYAQLATDPQTLNVPSGFAGATFESFFLHQFLGRAFDAYVLDDADLDAALAEAQRQADEFSACVAGVAPVTDTSTQEELEANGEAIENCLKQVAPEIAAEREAMMPGGGG
ncbi:MAG: extracellular solute-binding protein [Anaerolineaceae bacterium]|nr:extracellular solute-binding protein [Anaerolineaceae bacterium]